MTIKKSEKIDFEHFISLLTAVEKSVIHIRQTPDHNNSIDISVSSTNDDTDQLDPLRIPEVIIVICVLLLWCGSIFIFIRHSELLRIRHRDLPFRSAIKPPMNLNRITVVNRTSDMVIHSKSRISSTNGLTPPISNYTMNGYRHDETFETLSSPLSPRFNKRRHTNSFELNTPSSIKHSFNKHNNKEQLLHPHRISSEIKQSLLNLHRKSVDNVSSIKYSAYYSANDISRRKHSDGHILFVKKRCVQESPV